MEANWREEGFTSPNSTTYPWQWLWDSCFHALIWHRLGRTDRALSELRNVFADQGSTGFVPHMRYVGDAAAVADFWGRTGTSSITQPPMFGHAIAELVRSGVEVGELLTQATIALRHLLGRERTPAGLVPIFHPWESGCDDSPRWDSDPDQFDAQTWWVEKGRFVDALQFDASGAPSANPSFTTGSIGFNALVAFNAAELVSVGADELAPEVGRLAAAVGERHDDQRGTWIDDSSRPGAGRRTLDAHLALLIADDDQFDRRVPDLFDPGVFGARFGPAGVGRAEPSRRNDEYWRGPSWPQLSYLMWVACRRRDRPDTSRLRRSLERGVAESGFAEYWNPDTGAGLGARPQSWACVVALLD